MVYWPRTSAQKQFGAALRPVQAVSLLQQIRQLGECWRRCGVPRRASAGWPSSSACSLASRTMKQADLGQREAALSTAGSPSGTQQVEKTARRPPRCNVSTAFYLYQVWQLHALNELRTYAFPGGHPSTVGEARMPLYIAEAALEPLITRSVFQLRTSVQPGYTLRNAIRTLKAKVDAEFNDAKVLDWSDVYQVNATMSAFEAVLGAELAPYASLRRNSQGGF